MSVKVDERAYRTLTLFLISCQSTVGEEVLKAYFSYKGEIPATFEDILGDYAWTIEKVPNNVFLKLIQYAESNAVSILTAEMICLYFGSEEHLDTAKNSCIVYGDLTQEQKIAGHLTLPVRITSITDGKISGEITYNGLEVDNIFDVVGNVQIGDIVLIHFATIVLYNPSPDLVTRLTKMQNHFAITELKNITKLKYPITLDNTIKRLHKYTSLRHN
ncbi:hypothetical protein HGB13_04435 [bacterium]|nr:hypothetical protein [bacterium]